MIKGLEGEFGTFIWIEDPDGQLVELGRNR
jgi:hypothetical protein